MKTPRALVLYEDADYSHVTPAAPPGTGCRPAKASDLRGVLTGEGCRVEEAFLNSHTAPLGDGYCIVVFDIQRLTARLLELVRAFKDNAPDATLLVCGGRTGQPNRIAVLEAGVEAYLTKPVVLPELRARVRAALRRFRSHDATLRRFSLGYGTIDLEARMIHGAGRETRLTPTECGILEHLAMHMNQTVPSIELVRTLWGDDPQKGVHSLRLFIRKLRNKLEPDPAHPRYLVTEPTIGYRLQVTPEAATKSLDS